MQYFLYIIGKTEDLSDYEKCYVGVTNNPKQRWYHHTRSKFRIGNTIRKYKLTYENNMKVIFLGTERECFDKESELRPNANMGLNEAAGGLGGFTKYTQERNEKISAKMKTRKMTWGDKVSKTKKENGNAKGDKNVKAKRWLLISPKGKETPLHGNVASTCEELNLSASVLRIHKNKIVPPPNITSKRGGYRFFNDEMHQRRVNTTGWCLKEQ